MKVGDYVRTDKGEIGKLEELKLNYTKGKRLVTYYTYTEVDENYIRFDNTNITERFVNGSCYYLTDEELERVEKSIIKSSPNIIDLIEVGDYVNGRKVREVVKFGEDFYYCFKNDYNRHYDKNYKIKSIVTKEQFESIEYRIEE